MTKLIDQFGHLDIYIFDQLLRERITKRDKILDAGCGFGRNLHYFLQEGYEVFGIDKDPDAILEVRHSASLLAPHLPSGNFQIETLEEMSFPDNFADVVICSAVLHFANDTKHFMSMLHNSWNKLCDGGMFLARLASSIGMEQRFSHLRERHYRLLDGTERFLVDEAFLAKCSNELGGKLLDPLKTTIVQDQRCMTTWVLRKTSAAKTVINQKR